jgi:hypothetical protein
MTTTVALKQPAKHATVIRAELGDRLMMMPKGIGTREVGR